MASRYSSRTTRRGGARNTRLMRERQAGPTDATLATTSNRKLPTRRISRACDLCRSKKLRCDGIRPTCRACSLSGQDCTYGTGTKKRGLPTGYVRILEALWGLVFEAVPDSMQTVLTLLQDAHVIWDEDDKVTLFSCRASSGDGLRQSWARSSVRQKIDEMVLDIEKGEKPSPRGCIEDSNPEPLCLSSWTQIGLLHTNLAQRPRSNEPVAETQDVRDVQADTLAATTGASQTYSMQLLKGPHDTFQPRSPLPTNAWSLIDTHSLYTNSWLPIVPRNEVVRIISLYQDDSACTLPEMAIMWAVLALSSFAHHRDKPFSGLPLCRLYYCRALSLVKLDDSVEYSEFVPALVLLAMLDMSDNKWEAASILIGNAVRAGLMTRDDGTPRCPARHSLFILSAFAIDTLAAARMRFVPHLRSKDVRSMLDYDSQGPEEWEQWPGEQQPLRSLSVFKEYVKLLMILNDCIYESQLCSHGFISKISSELESWLFGLPKHCNFNSTANPQEAKQETPIMTAPVANLGIMFDVVLSFIQASARSDLDSNVELNLQESPSRLKQIYLQTFKSHPWNGILNLHDHVCSLRSTTMPASTLWGRRLTTTRNSANIPINSFGSQTILGDLCSQRTIEELIDELSTTQTMADYNGGSNQFMYDLGFFDT